MALVDPDVTYWRAISSLREAETLAQMPGDISGPADEAPTPGNEESFVNDWSGRAREALKKAFEWHASPIAAVKERARRIAKRIYKGARDLRDIPEKLSDAARKRLELLEEAAKTLLMRGGVAAVLTAVIALAVGWYLLDQFVFQKLK